MSIGLTRKYRHLPEKMKMRIAAYQFAVTGDMVENFEK